MSNEGGYKAIFPFFNNGLSLLNSNFFLTLALIQEYGCREYNIFDKLNHDTFVLLIIIRLLTIECSIVWDDHSHKSYGHVFY